MLMERIDYLLISAALQQNVISSDILPMYISDHAVPTIQINFVSLKLNKGYWKFNNLLLNDEIFCSKVIDTIGEVMTFLKYLPMVQKWDMLKLAIRDVAISRGIQIARSRNNKIKALQKAIYNNTVGRDQEG